jgi:hypothetical protein
MRHQLPLHTPGREQSPRPVAAEADEPALRKLALRPVRQLTGPTIATARRFAAAELPLVIRGALDDCPAVGRFTPRYLLEHAGELRAQAYVQPEGRVRLDRFTGFELRETVLREYASEVLAGRNPPYYFRAPVDMLPAALQAELPTPRYCRGALRLRRNLWFSAPDTISRLHFDLPHNLIAQLTGRKRFVLYPFREYLNLYPFAPWSSTPHVSRVALEEPDHRKFPRLPLARGWHCDLQEGDMLLVPSRTWHHAVSLGASVTVNHWWPPLSVLPLTLMSNLYKRLRGLNI